MKYTVEDVVGMEKHAELICNKLVITDMTTVAHNRAVNIISRACKSDIAGCKTDERLTVKQTETNGNQKSS